MNVRRRMVLGLSVPVFVWAVAVFAWGVTALPLMAWPGTEWVEDAPANQLPRPKINKPDEDEGVRLPSGKLQRDAIVEHEHKKNLEDLREIQKLSGELLEELEANTGHVFSLGSLRKMEHLEKRSKQLKNRFKQ